LDEIRGATETDDTQALRVELNRRQGELEESRRRIQQMKWTEALLAGEKRLLEMLARGESLGSILEAACKVVEETSVGTICSILLLDASGERLWHGAAPSLPRSYIDAVNGREIKTCLGPCATAAFRRERVIVPDVEALPPGAEYRDLALAHGLKACWASPIISSETKVLGTFAIYSRQPASPTAQQSAIIEQITHLAAVAIERKRAEDALRASERLACGQVEALKRTLDVMSMESNPDKLVEHVLRTITRQLDAHSSSVWLKDETRDLMVFEFALEDGKLKTRRDPALAAITRPSSPEAYWPWPEVTRTGKPYVMEDMRDGPDVPWRSHLLGQGVVTVLVVPMLVSGKAAGLIGIRFTRKRGFRAEELELAQALANQAMLAIQLIRLSARNREAAVVAERNRLARDIHDTLAQGFTGVIVQLEAAEDAISQGLTAETVKHLEQAGEVARHSLKEARRSVQALRPLALEEKNLCDALEDLLRKMAAGTAVQAEFILVGEARPRPAEWDENLLRIGQEVLTNTLRHARATSFNARLVFEAEEVRLELSDNGRGFDPDGRHDGFGLRGIRERVEAMGGRLEIHSERGEGTAISVSLPLGEHAPAATI